MAPKKPGKLVIAAIKVSYNGKDYNTEKIIVNVGQGQKKNSSNTNKSSNNSKLFAKIKSSSQNISSSNINFDALSFYAQVKMDKLISDCKQKLRKRST